MLDLNEVNTVVCSENDIYLPFLYRIDTAITKYVGPLSYLLTSVAKTIMVFIGVGPITDVKCLFKTETHTGPLGNQTVSVMNVSSMISRRLITSVLRLWIPQAPATQLGCLAMSSILDLLEQPLHDLYTARYTQGRLDLSSSEDSWADKFIQ